MLFGHNYTFASFVKKKYVGYCIHGNRLPTTNVLGLNFTSNSINNDFILYYLELNIEGKSSKNRYMI